MVKKWQGKSQEVDWIIKHGCRTLLKLGNSEIMTLFGLGSVESISIDNFQILTSKVKVGNSLEFGFSLKNIILN